MFVSLTFSECCYAYFLYLDVATASAYFAVLLLLLSFSCWIYRRRQNEGYINYTRIAWSDHSYAYDSSKYQDPPSHLRQGETHGAYKHRKVLLQTRSNDFDI